MFGFFKKKEKAETWSVRVDDVYYDVDLRVAKYFENLKRENSRLKNDNDILREQIKELKAYTSIEGYAPAVSQECGDCMYVVKSRCLGGVIGCRKNMICEDFKPKGE